MEASTEFIIPRSVYNYDTIVLLGSSNKKIEEKFKEWGYMDLIEWVKLEGETCNGIVDVTPDGVFLLRTRRFPETVNDYGTLQHEIFHLADELFRRIGLVLSADSCEAYAYYIGYLTRTIYTQIELAKEELYRKQQEALKSLKKKVPRGQRKRGL